MIKHFLQYAKMDLVHVQVARPIRTRNKQADLKTCSTSFVTENTKTLYSNPSRQDDTPQCLVLRYQVIAKIDNQVQYIKTSLIYI